MTGHGNFLNRPILGYSVEMYDLPTGNWVSVTQTDDGATRQVDKAFDILTNQIYF